MDGRKLRDLCYYMSTCQVEPQNSSADTTQGGVESLREHLPAAPTTSLCLPPPCFWRREDDPAEGLMYALSIRKFPPIITKVYFLVPFIR